MSTDAANPGENNDSADRRATERLNFRQPERIAPYTSGAVPPVEAFLSVPFLDISQGGFSFLSEHVPRSPFLVVAVKVPDGEIYMKARVIHHRNNPDDGPAYVVGCQFAGRIFQEEDWGDIEDELDYDDPELADGSQVQQDLG